MRPIYLLIFNDCTLLTYDRKEAIECTKEHTDGYLLRVDAMFPVFNGSEYCASTVEFWNSAKPTEYNVYI